ncbi:hypothetical protein E2C01_058691 [Portunus trituberculatus]|uniref:Uncharacterized protein n=1 Tax=Portunus trituberculatus TaxID=210409 RepID=A0A5B7H3D9_PORTR|nr:hypothetical protein [Portunus trituberculatus]
MCSRPAVHTGCEVRDRTVGGADAERGSGRYRQDRAAVAVKWYDFFNARQLGGESVSVYMTRCAQEVADCGIQCPRCDSSLSEYMLLRKVMAGLSDQCLRQEVYRKCGAFSDIDSLREFCVSFEAARRNAVFGGKSERDHAVAGADVTADDITEESLVASYRQRAPHPAGLSVLPSQAARPASPVITAGKSTEKHPAWHETWYASRVARGDM